MKHSPLRRALALGALSAMAVVAAPAAQAQGSYPSNPITLVVPFAAGSGTDAVARVVATRLGERLKQPVIVDNKAGANAQIAANHVAKARSRISRPWRAWASCRLRCWSPPPFLPRPCRN